VRILEELLNLLKDKDLIIEGLKKELEKERQARRELEKVNNPNGRKDREIRSRAG